MALRRFGHRQICFLPALVSPTLSNEEDRNQRIPGRSGNRACGVKAVSCHAPCNPFTFLSWAGLFRSINQTARMVTTTSTVVVMRM